MLEKYDHLEKKLGGAGASEQVANLILHQINKPKLSL
jgi:hypothetical protein